MLTITIPFAFILGLTAFVSEFIDSSLGMGYGTALTPILLLMGFEPAVVVPSVLLSEFVTGFLAAAIHQSMGNVNFFPRKANLEVAAAGTGTVHITRKLRLTLPRATKVLIVIGLGSVAATLLAVWFSIALPALYVKIYIAVMIIVMGFVILITSKKNGKFSWVKISILGIIASFNKGVSGGGYGPVATGGQILSGMKPKEAVAITSFAEGLTCLVGVTAYVLSRGFSQLRLAPYLVIGAVLSVPLSAFVVKRMDTKRFTYIIGSVTLALGIVSILKLVL